MDASGAFLDCYVISWADPPKNLGQGDFGRFNRQRKKAFGSNSDVDPDAPEHLLIRS
jgi:hypothetical protein